MSRLPSLAIALLVAVAAPAAGGPPGARAQAVAPDLAADAAQIQALLNDPDPARRIAGCKLVRGKVRAHGVPGLSGAVTPLLLERLNDADAEVRLWVVLALRVLDDRSLPALRTALERERDPKVASSLKAVIRQFEQARSEETARQAHPCQKIHREEIMRWPIRELCDPIGHYPPVLFTLPDGTSVYRRNDQECFRGRRSRNCRNRCLPASARIDTPDGPRRVDELRRGDIVWSVDASGNRLQAPLLRVGSVEVGDQHQLIRVRLSDGRAVEASWYHPTAGGGIVGELAPGSNLDGSTVVEVRSVRANGHQTFDILPGGPTGLYFAEGVLLGSTLRDAGRELPAMTERAR